MTKEATANEQDQSLGGVGDIEKKASRQGSTRSLKSTKSSTKAAKPTSAASMPLTSTQQRRIRAEDPDWSLETVPLLIELVVKHIVQNFEYNSKILHDLPEKHKRKVLDSISTNIPIKVTALLVDYEDYWKRCCQARWQKTTGDVSLYGQSWKRMYFERNLQEIIENCVPCDTDPPELMEVMPLSANFIKRLEIKQLLPPVKEAPKGPDSDDLSDGEDSESVDGNEIDHFDFETIMRQLPHLEEFHVTYGVKNCGMNFEWSLFQFTARDCLLLAKCIAACKTLKVFRLHKSKVDDDKVRVLISHILDHPGLVELDLSHNVISDRGARAVGKFLNNHSRLVKLNLCDNNIRAAGAQAIAHALTKNSTLTSLNLRMNRLADEGGQAVCRALLKNETLLDLNLGSNDLTEPTATFLSQVLMENKTLNSIDLSCNRLGPDGGKQLQEGMEENQSVTEMDLRLTECGQESEYCIHQILSRNREKKRQIEEMFPQSPNADNTLQDNAAV